MTNMKGGGDSENRSVHSSGPRGCFFEIRVKGHLDQSWAEWLEGLDVRLLDEGQMLLSGQIRDQAALMGILTKLYNLNLTLISVSERGQEE